MKKLFLFGFLSLIFLQQSFSQIPGAEMELNPLTVTSSLDPVSVSQTGRNITTIPGDYFNRYPVHSIDDLLRYTPGVEVQQRGPGGSQADIVLRGGTFQQVLIILDGLRLNDPNTGHFNSYIPIAPAEIDRIEILKGAASAVYGSEAVGGVIHVITKTFAAKKRPANMQFSAMATGGEYDLLNVAAGGFIQNKNTVLGGGLLSNNSDGQLQRGTRGAFNNHTVSLSLKQFISDALSISVRNSYDDRSFGAQNFYTTFLSDTASEDVQSHWNQLAVQYKTGKHQLELDAGYKMVKDIFQYNPQSVANNNKSKLFQLLLTDRYRIGDHTTIVAGLQYQNKVIRSNDRGNHSLKQVAGFVVLNQQWRSFSLSPAVRVDYNDLGGTEFIPQLNISFHKEKWQLRASGGKTTRDADFTERYNNYNKVFVSGGSIGNPNLKAEQSFSYELGGDYFFNKSIKVSATGFQRRQSELIDWVRTAYANMPRRENLSPTGTYALASNISEVTTSGAELDLQMQRTFGKSRSFVGMLGMLWMYSDVDKGIPSFYLLSHARFMTNASLEYSTKIFSVSVNGLYKHRSAQAAPAIKAVVDRDLFVMNGRVGVFVWKQKASVFAQVDNVFDANRSDLLGTRLPGRWLMGGVKVGFK